jgi:NADPH:quinone reductase-like Zn-dependent oxidoreductase
MNVLVLGATGGTGRLIVRFPRAHGRSIQVPTYCRTIQTVELYKEDRFSYES